MARRYGLVDGIIRILEVWVEIKPKPFQRLLQHWERLDEKEQAKKLEVIGVDKEKWR